MLLFTAYQIWGTSVQEAHIQSGLRTQLQHETDNDAIKRALAQESALDKLPTGPPVAAPTRPLPPRGSRSATSGSLSSASTRSWSRARIRPTSARDRGTTRERPFPAKPATPPSRVTAPRTATPSTTSTRSRWATRSSSPRSRASSSTTPPRASSSRRATPPWSTTSSPTNSPSRPAIRASVRRRASWSRPHWPTPNSSRTPVSCAAQGAHGAQGLRPWRPKSRAWPATRRSLGEALLWGFVTAAVIAGIFVAAWRFRRRRWVIYGVGAVGTLVLLWFFFGAVSPLLPASF